MFNIFEEIPWFYFKELPEIRYLPINEQVEQYNKYLDILSFERINYLNWLDSQGKGTPNTSTSNNSGKTWDNIPTKWENDADLWES